MTVEATLEAPFTIHCVEYKEGEDATLEDGVTDEVTLVPYVAERVGLGATDREDVFVRVSEPDTDGVRLILRLCEALGDRDAVTDVEPRGAVLTDTERDLELLRV